MRARRFIGVLFAAAAVFAALMYSVGIAAAAPVTTPVSTGTLPDGFPADLRQFVSDTDEFRAAWFSGVCADRGGDVGAYVNAVMPVEDRLLYWTADDKQKAQLLGGDLPDRQTAVQTLISQHGEPPKDMLPRVFPAGDPEYRMPAPACADDLKRWTGRPAWKVWGFDWATHPDDQSMTAIRAQLGGQKVPDQVWTDPCHVGFAYCSHAFFVDCAGSDPANGDQTHCLVWNRAVGKLFGGTANWLDQNTTLSDRIEKVVDAAVGSQFAGGAAIASGFGWLWKVGSSVARFVDNPESVIDDWANSSKDSAVELSSRVLDGLASVGRFDPTAEWFLHWYALSTGIGVIVMGAMTLLALWRAAAKGETIKTISADLFGYMPAGVLLMLFAPMFATLLVTLANDASDAITRAAGPDMGHMITNLQMFTGKLTSKDLVGGTLVGLLLFLLLIAGALAVFFGLLMHQVALPMLAVASGIGFGMWVHPHWRRKALRPVLLFVAIVFSKPLLFLLLATMTGLLNSALTEGGTGQEQLGVLGQLCLVVVAFLVVGLAPWTLLRYAPLLPSRSDAAGFGQSGSLMAGAVGGAGTAMWWTGRGRGGRGSGRSGRGSAGGGRSEGTGREEGSAEHTKDGGNTGASPTAARFSGTLSANTAAKSHRGREAARTALGGIGSVARGLGKTAMIASPIAAQAASGALNKARSTAEAAPGEAEPGSDQ
ncbi:hypothetical protein GPX89_26735 [Nocardia sp. ET3-3]|uniref:TrbL/VirB6 plasmid conjugal transfer protein n=1 Tax=Nocardia terrae TaxID=2675851 RepID=A0A7K1V2V1_9NOCA|nr:hypothetical protein [Nocardia terrae]MVU80837.1 hypothetical protein [Nocardia terrae]